MSKITPELAKKMEQLIISDRVCLEIAPMLELPYDAARRHTKALRDSLAGKKRKKCSCTRCVHWRDIYAGQFKVCNYFLDTGKRVSREGDMCECMRTKRG